MTASFDFETFSAAGYVWEGEKWGRLPGANDYGLKAVGLGVYAQHPSTEILCLQYNLHDGKGKRLWLPNMPPPFEIFDHLAKGGLAEAWNAQFEAAIWFYIGVCRLGWPALPVKQLRCAMARAQAYALPGALGKAAAVVGSTVQKDKDGERLLKMFSWPKQPSGADPRTRVHPHDDPANAQKLYDYCGVDIDAEDAVGEVMPHLTPQEQAFWEVTLQMNTRGVAIDLDAVQTCIAVLEVSYARAEQEVARITGGAVTTLSQIARITDWLAPRGVFVTSLDAEHLEGLLHPSRADKLPPECRRVLELRQQVGSAGVKKVYAMARMADPRGRLCYMYIYHGARTGRDTGADVQPQNLVKKGPKLRWCVNPTCAQPFSPSLLYCPHCQAPTEACAVCGKLGCIEHAAAWSYKAVDAALRALGRGYDEAQRVFGDPVLLISGCIRGMFIAGPGMQLVCSDYSSIEAVVTAVLSGEQWRIDAFHRGDDIYLTSAGKIKGHTLDWYMANGGKKHPDRQKIGKPAELGLGFGGWLGAWRQFDDSDTFTDEQVIENIKAWRAASPKVVELWGGQVRGKPWKPSSFELFGLEGMIIRAIQTPGTWCSVGLLSYYYCTRADVLYLQLPSGRRLSYHRPRLAPHPDQGKRPGQLEITYEGYNTNQKTGPIGWIRRSIYGGSAAENGIQAVARDLMVHGVLVAEAAGYTHVLRTHDEPVAEVPEGFGSVEEYERLITTLPAWATGWPVKASEGYIAKRYRKD